MSFEKDITEIKKMMAEQYRTDTETLPTEAPPTPSPAPTEKPVRRNNPLKPAPGIHPKPKASLTPDAELFLKKRGLLPKLGESTVVEAKPKKEYDTSVIHPDKMRWITTGDETLNKILPGLPPKQQEYLRKINSDSYTQLVDRVEKFTGIRVTRPNMPQLFSLVMQSIQQVAALEARYKHTLEEMAVELVLGIPEFKIVEDAYMRDDISIDAKLGPAELQRLTQPEPEAAPELEGLSKDEELNFKMADFLEGTSDEDIKRRFANLMISGGAVDKLYVYNTAAAKLKKIDPKLPNLYGIASSMVNLLYWIIQPGIEQGLAEAPEAAMGSEEVIPKGDKYIIKARAVIFPFLVHELCKGFYEYMALDPTQQIAMQKDKVEDETRDFMAGPGIRKTVISYLKPEDAEIISLVQKKLTAMGPAEIREVLGKTSKGKEIMAGIIQASRDEWESYKKSEANYKDAQ